MFDNWRVRDEYEQIGKLSEFEAIYNEIGEQRFTQAVTRCIRKHATGFFPTIGEFMNYAHEENSVDGRSEWPGCGECKNGWLSNGARPVATVKRCECWKRAHPVTAKVTA